MFKIFVTDKELFNDYLKDIVPLRAQDHDTLVEMMVLHCGGRVEDGQGRLDLGLESVIGSSVIQIVTKTSHQEAKDLEIHHEPVHLASLEHGEHGLADVERVPPIVIAHGAVVLLDAEDPPA